MRPSSLLLLAGAPFISAQLTPAQIAAQIPSCVEPCDSNAILSVGCGLTDYACHCAHGAQLSQIIPPCLKNSSNCTVPELTLFGQLVGEICAALNVTGNATTSVKPSGTGSVVPTSVVPFAAGAERVGTGLVGVLVMGAAVMWGI